MQKATQQVRQPHVAPCNPMTQLSDTPTLYATGRNAVTPGATSKSGEGGIRTLVTVSGKLVFETNAIDHSATSPGE